ncbi:hypothetical protein BJ508DRAFT_326433 [Ascobolus immersus RN42]|uniref:Uncharacterized protein n=1 Tax=Ascobolus immersus RN42 TaxID=1160509 RepID=A0A3N4I5C5_ASCIM|nr:hypothetical protein BJ508DRAFT_326433 [Ascobolus immersus RN42]
MSLEDANDIDIGNDGLESCDVSFDSSCSTGDEMDDTMDTSYNVSFYDVAIGKDVDLDLVLAAGQFSDNFGIDLNSQASTAVGTPPFCLEQYSNMSASESEINAMTVAASKLQIADSHTAEDSSTFDYAADDARLRHEILFLDQLSRLTLSEQIELTANGADPHLHEELIRQKLCMEGLHHKGVSFFDHFPSRDNVDYYPTPGLQIRFEVGNDHRGNESVIANHVEVQWDSDNIVSKVGVNQTFDFEGFDLLMLLKSNHYVVGEVRNVTKTATSKGSRTFSVSWEASQSACSRVW